MKVATISERLKTIMAARGLKQVDVINLAKPYCDYHNVYLKKSSLNQYISGHAEPGKERLKILSLALDVSEMWLLGYDAPIERELSEEDNMVLRPSFHRKKPIKDIIVSKERALPYIRPIARKRLPMLGNVACGEPTFADEQHDAYVDAVDGVDADFCLTAKGDSMINARIFDGDILFVKQQESVDDGEIAVVLIEDETTVKRVYYDKENNVLTLMPENPTHKPMRFEGAKLDQIRILGKVVSGQYVVK